VRSEYANVLLLRNCYCVSSEYFCSSYLWSRLSPKGLAFFLSGLKYPPLPRRPLNDVPASLFDENGEHDSYRQCDVCLIEGDVPERNSFVYWLTPQVPPQARDYMLYCCDRGHVFGSQGHRRHFALSWIFEEREEARQRDQPTNPATET